MPLVRPTLPAALLKAVEQRHKLEQAIRACLPSEHAKHVFLLNVRRGSLILGCDRQALITPLRFEAPRMLEAVRTILGDKAPQRVAWRTIAPLPERGVRKVRRAPSMASGALESAAAHLDDPMLACALKRLAQALDKSRKQRGTP